MDWLQSRQDAIEARLARRHPHSGGEPAADGPVRPVQLVVRGLALPAGGPRLSRDGKKGNIQIEYGPLTAPRADLSRSGSSRGTSELSFFDEQDLADISSSDLPGERLIACRNPALAGERARRREDLLTATEKLLAPIAARVRAGRLPGSDAIGVAVSEVTGKYKMAKHFTVTITDDSLTVERKQAQIDDEARLDGIYVIRTPVPEAGLGAAGVVTACKNLKHVERDFRHIKSGDLDLRPSSTGSKSASKDTC